jgi:hypothetical protein
VDLLQIGQFVGAVVAGFGASWAAFGRPLSKQLEETKILATAPSAETLALRDRLTKVEAAHTRYDQLHDAHQQRFVRVEQRQEHAVSDEEFSTHQQATAKSINTLTEKVGRAIGTLEAWRNQ